MYPIADLTAFCRRTTGDVPPKLVGASTTVVGSKMYLYGGRLVAERRMVSDIYMFDLESFKWEKVQQSPEEDIPQARYFHSADTWNNHLIIFGGMAIQPQSDNPEDLCVLNDVRLFDLSSRRWLPASATSDESGSPSLIPKARYAHLSSVTANRLFVIGGQDLNNVWLDDIHVYDLNLKKWVQRRDYPRHCGTYRSVAVTANQRVRIPQEERPNTTKIGPVGKRFQVDKNAPPVSNATSSESLIHLPYSAPPTEEHPCDIYLFSNYNFTDVQRELEVFSPLPDSDFSITDRSSAMTGSSFPPGLRFPTGAILGSHFIIAGTYLSQTFQSYCIWTLDLVSMTWSRIDPGSALAGSWFRSCLWPEANKFLIFGNKHGNLVEDYNRRLLSWDHVAVIDLEAFGIYQPPPLLLDIPMQEMGLAALEEGVMADFDIICDDGRKVSCSRKVLEERWPWFKEQRRLFIQAATRAIEAIPSPNATTPLSELPVVSTPSDPRPDPRLMPRSFQLSEPYPITLAFVQYFYSMALITPLQHAPAVLSQLLLLSSTYELPHLQSLVKHAMHRALTFATSVGIYGVSTLCNCRSLQIRALRVVMAYSQKRPGGAKARVDRDRDGAGGGNARPTGPDGPRSAQELGGPGGPSSGAPSAAARPRGMSDASYMQRPYEPPAMAPPTTSLPAITPPQSSMPGSMTSPVLTSPTSSNMSVTSGETATTHSTQSTTGTKQSSRTSITSTSSSGKSVKGGKGTKGNAKSPKIKTANANDAILTLDAFPDDDEPTLGSFGIDPVVLRAPSRMSDTPTTSFSVRSMDHFSSSSLQAALNEEESLFPGASSSHVLPSPSSPFPPPIRPRVSRPSTAPTTPNSNSRPSTPSTNPNLPVPMFLHRKLSTRRERRESILSLTTEEELQSFAEIMSVSLRDDGTAPEQPQAPESFGIPIEDEDAVIDDILSFGDLMPPRVRPDRFSMSTSYTQSSRHTGSSSASEFDILDAYAENAYLSPNHSNFPQLQIPRGRVPSSDCDTPSLRSSVSNSSISSPTLSRTSSFQHFFPASPLSSSASSPLPTPVDGPPAGIGGLGLRGLDVIEENRHSEEFDPSYHPPRDPSTIRTFNRQVYNSRPQAGYNQYQYQDDGVPQEKAMMDNGWTYVRPSDVVWEPRTNPHASEMQDGNRLRMRAGSPETIIPEPASPVIQAKSTTSLGQNSTGQQSSKSSGSGSHHSGGGLGGFGRLFGKKSKSSHNDDVLKSPSSSTSDLADEKQRKKEVAKARREQLALELKRKDEARKAAELEARKSAKKPAPRDAGGMWDGVSVSVL